MPLGQKQLDILRFRRTSYSYLICDGAVRSGKTSIMMVGFVDDAMERFNAQRFGICGKTVDSAIKNVIEPYISMRYAQQSYQIKWSRSGKILTITKGGVTNIFEVFGGKDESSYMLIQGRTIHALREEGDSRQSPVVLSQARKSGFPATRREHSTGLTRSGFFTQKSAMRCTCISF